MSDLVFIGGSMQAVPDMREYEVRLYARDGRAGDERYGLILIMPFNQLDNRAEDLRYLYCLIYAYWRKCGKDLPAQDILGLAPGAQ